MTGQPTSWRQWRPVSTLSWSPETIQVLAFPLTPAGRQIDGLETVLSPTERARARRYIRAVDRQRYVVAHAALRQILSRRLRCAPGELVFERNAGGQPRLIGLELGLHFSLAHSGDVGLVAFSTTRQVGVDVEHDDAPVDWRGVAGRFLPLGERRALERLNPEVQRTEFFAAWTRYEATLKLHGTGLTQPPSSITSRTPAVWTDNLPVGPGLAAAVASAIPRAPVQLNRWLVS